MIRRPLNLSPRFRRHRRSHRGIARSAQLRRRLRVGHGAPLRSLIAAPTAARLPCRRVLVALDCATNPVLLMGMQLAQACGAVLGIVHVVDSLTVAAYGDASEPFGANVRAHGWQVLLEARQQLVGQMNATLLYREGKPSEQIVMAALDWGADLILMGAPHRGLLARLLFESTAQRVARKARRCVLLVEANPLSEETP